MIRKSEVGQNLGVWVRGRFLGVYVLGRGVYVLGRDDRRQAVKKSVQSCRGVSRRLHFLLIVKPKQLMHHGFIGAPSRTIKNRLSFVKSYLKGPGSAIDVQLIQPLGIVRIRLAVRSKTDSHESFYFYRPPRRLGRLIDPNNTLC